MNDHQLLHLSVHLFICFLLCSNSSVLFGIISFLYKINHLHALPTWQTVCMNDRVRIRYPSFLWIPIVWSKGSIRINQVDLRKLKALRSIIIPTTAPEKFNAIPQPRAEVRFKEKYNPGEWCHKQSISRKFDVISYLYIKSHCKIYHQIY